MDLVVNLLAILVLPSVMFSFSRFVAREEYQLLRETGQKLNLNLHNLRMAYRRKPDDPLRDIHVRLAKIGFLHWAAIPIGFLAVFLFAIALELLEKNSL